ncbi:HlyC/CorC family transporter [Ilyomonas limi]|uniref:HlyC/CorC family transporter n=1 Tax=Ilyomonas limi TaxID=2575867 RepID=A0A4U3KSW8_9BACT|nr:hemolysin family protein [Ilyomonas limi]TKK65585.1 HlyC/CorC family transporter [Ilyomonas limi]
MIEVLIILALIILNGVFAMSEMALVSARRARLESQAAKGDKKAREALDLASHPDQFISTVQLAITLITLLNGIFSGKNIEDDIITFLNRYEVVRPYSTNIATVLVIIVITYFSLVLGELVPKRIGLSNPEGIAKNIAGPMRIVSRITYPFIWLLGKSSNAIIKLFNIKPNETPVTEEEIKAIISEGTEHGTIEEAEQLIIERVFRLGDRNITSLMTHRSDITWLDVNLTVADVKNKFDIHSVYPLCEGSIDQIKGVIYLKDLFVAQPETPLKDIAQLAMYVPENNTAYHVLEKFQSSKIHYAFIVDEYGTLQGMITLNDILEAIVGDIAQPHEEDYEIVAREDGSFLVDAQLPFFNFLSHFYKTDWLGNDEEEDDFNTLAGFILYHLERIPVTGDKLEYRGFTFEIVDMDGQRIDKVLITLSPEEMEAYTAKLNEE